MLPKPFLAEYSNLLFSLSPLALCLHWLFVSIDGDLQSIFSVIFRLKNSLSKSSLRWTLLPKKISNNLLAVFENHFFAVFQKAFSLKAFGETNFEASPNRHFVSPDNVAINSEFFSLFNVISLTVWRFIPISVCLQDGLIQDGLIHL